MQNHKIDKPRSFTGPSVATIPQDREQALQQFVLMHYGSLVDKTFEAYPGLLYSDPERIVMRLGHNLRRYGGPVEAESFLIWACRWVANETRRYDFLDTVLREHSRTIRSAISRYLWTSAEDCAVDAEDIFAEVLALIFQSAHSLRKPGRAKLSTRLTGLVKRHVDFYHNHRRARRLEVVRKYPMNIACEQLSSEELASMQSNTDDDSFLAWAKHGYERTEHV